MLKKKLVAIIVFAGFVAVAWYIKNNPPEADRRAPVSAPKITVETQRIQPQSFNVIIDSFGTVKPRTRSNLVAQVSGQIQSISDSFRDGGVFKAGQVLVTIDQRDYQSEIKIAQASLLTAQQALAEEQARSIQAAEDWKRLGNGKQPTDLVLRKPQLMAAEAKVLSAEAALEKAKLALSRTEIVAPFDGRVLSKKVDIGQVVSNNGVLAEIFATDYVEIRLPIKNNDLRFVQLPEQGESAADSRGLPVEIISNLGISQTWLGRAVRTESAIDATTQQLYVIAQIDNPFAASEAQQQPLKIGQYVAAKLRGNTLDNAIVIPNKAIYQSSYVYVVEGNILLRKDISILWQNNEQSLIDSGLKAGDELVLTALGQVHSGTPVIVSGADSVNKDKQSVAEQRRAGKGSPRNGDGEGRKRPVSDSAANQTNGV